MSKKILVVDDEHFITRSLSFMFQKEGYECYVANNGETAMEQIAGCKPDIVFLDIDMPLKDGIQVVREIRCREDSKDIFIIMLTAKGQKIDEKASLEAGANEYIMKPFDPRAILSRIKEIIG
jgi:DNA-binding response OmpR family regulator